MAGSRKVEFPLFSECSKCAGAADSDQRDRLIEQVIALPMEALWDNWLKEAYRELPGLGKESRSRGPRWLRIRYCPVSCELVPTKSFYPFIGLPGPEKHRLGDIHSLVLGFWFSPSLPLRREAAGLTLSLVVQRAIPVKSLLSLWNHRRESLELLIRTAAVATALPGYDESYRCDALDHYRRSGNRHAVRFERTVNTESEIASFSATFLSLARLYHVLQGCIRGDNDRVELLTAR